jgi:uncharacterized YccA/Bax inhibitor family protein
MPSPVLNDKRFEEPREEWQPGWAAGAATQTQTQSEGGSGRIVPILPGAMTASGTFAKTGVLFVILLAAGAFGWSQVTATPAGEIKIPGWTWIALFVGLGLAFACIFMPKQSRFLSPLYAIAEGLFLGVISKAFENQWDGIVLQAVLATISVFAVTLFLYVSEVVKVTKKFQMVVISATAGIFLLYVMGFILSLFGVDMVFWNEPSAFGILFSVGVCIVAALNLFLDYEFIRQAVVAGAPKYMEWYGAFGIIVTLVWLYLEILRLLSLLRQ